MINIIVDLKINSLQYSLKLTTKTIPSSFSWFEFRFFFFKLISSITPFNFLELSAILKENSPNVCDFCTQNAPLMLTFANKWAFKLYFWRHANYTLARLSKFNSQRLLLMEFYIFRFVTQKNACGVYCFMCYAASRCFFFSMFNFSLHIHSHLFVMVIMAHIGLCL